jgi:hypothetical protein
VAILAGAVMAIILIVLATVLPAKADENDDSEMTPIENANVVCGDKGGAIYINAKDERVWQGELNDPEGIEHRVLEFKRFRCPDTYEIKSRVTFMGEYMDFKIRTKGCGKKKTTMTVKMLVRKESETFRYTCQ